jgi:hypothetical protein
MQSLSSFRIYYDLVSILFDTLSSKAPESLSLVGKSLLVSRGN